MNVAGLIGIAIFIVIAIVLIGPVMSAVNDLPEEASSGVIGSIANLLPIIFVAVIIIGATRYIGGFCGSRSDEKEEKKEKKLKICRNGKDFVISIETKSNRLERYINNLDELLGIKTTVFVDDNGEYGLKLENGELFIDDRFHWYLVDKHDKFDMFKVVGLHKKDQEKNVAYVLGKNEEAYLIQVANSYVNDQEIYEVVDRGLTMEFKKKIGIA